MSNSNWNIENIKNELANGDEIVTKAVERAVESFVNTINQAIEIYQLIPSHKVPHEEAVKAFDLLSTTMNIHSSPNMIVHGNSSTVKRFEARQQEVVELFSANNRPLKRQEIADKLNVTTQTVIKVLDHMVANGKLYQGEDKTSVGRGRAAYIYQLR